jgi:hypothetical protein
MVGAITQLSGAELMVVSSRGPIGLVASPSHAVRCDTLERGAVADPELARQAPVSSCRSAAGLLASTPREKPVSARDRHLAAVARTFGWAEEAAAPGDYTDALGSACAGPHSRLAAPSAAEQTGTGRVTTRRTDSSFAHPSTDGHRS